jgi:hypothetical protein
MLVAMTNAPTTALELRERCMNLPEDVVADAVVAAFKDVRPAPAAVLPPGAALFAEKSDRRQPRSSDDASLIVLACFVARWLTDRDLAQATLDKPPRLSPDLHAAIWRYLCERNQTLTSGQSKML